MTDTFKKLLLHVVNNIMMMIEYNRNLSVVSHPKWKSAITMQCFCRAFGIFFIIMSMWKITNIWFKLITIWFTLLHKHAHCISCCFITIIIAWIWIIYRNVYCVFCLIKIYIVYNIYGLICLFNLILILK